jgi:arylsulfatase A-like enzyme
MAAAALGGAASPARPNIVFILADDIGYGDVGCYGATRVRTPHVDRIAREGVRFTDAHAAASVCSPSRYALITGQYAFRNPAADHILSGEDPLTIDTSRTTVASLLKRAGHATGLVGKWHLGLGREAIDWNREIKPGPLEVGFDQAYFYAATNDRVPCVYIDGRRVVGLDPRDPLRTSYKGKIGNEPTGREQPEALKLGSLQGHDGTIVDGISRIGHMTGGKAAWWKDEEMGDTFTGKAVSFIEQHRSRPFFLYFASHNIHQPRWPNPRFRGTSECGTRCDTIREFDASVGAVLETLDRLKLTGNTLVMVSSDNGAMMDDGYRSFDVRDANGHQANGSLRGVKGTLYEGGHRVPLVARWPGRIKAGTKSDEMVCLVDLLATCASVTGQKVAAGEGEDSVDMLPAMTGGKGREHLVMQANSRKMLAVRKGSWKLLPSGELYNLAEDPAESRNVAGENAGKVRELTELLGRIRG